MPTLNWIGKDAVIDHHRKVSFDLLRHETKLPCDQPDVHLVSENYGQLRPKEIGFDVFHTCTGKMRITDSDGIAYILVDKNYDGESSFVCHAHFLGASHRNKSLKTTLKAKIDQGP